MSLPNHVLEHEELGIDSYRGKWNYLTLASVIYWGPTQGKADLTKEVLLNGFVWQFIPLVFARNAGEITDLFVFGQNNVGAGAAVNLGWGLWLPDTPAATNSGKLGAELASGVAATTDNSNGAIQVASGLSVKPGNNMVWFGVGSDANFNLQVRDSAGPIPGMAGLGGANNLSVVAASAISIGVTPPVTGSNIVTALNVSALYSKWRPI